MGGQRGFNSVLQGGFGSPRDSTYLPIYYMKHIIASTSTRCMLHDALQWVQKKRKLGSRRRANVFWRNIDDSEEK